jgi:hypothetical protein
MNYYERPDRQSDEAILCQTLITLTGVTYTSITHFLDDLKAFGKLYVKCTGFNERDGRQFPKFKIITDRLPPHQSTLKRSEVRQSTKSVRSNNEELHHSEINPSTTTLTPEEADNLKQTIRNAGYTI